MWGNRLALFCPALKHLGVEVGATPPLPGCPKCSLKGTAGVMGCKAQQGRGNEVSWVEMRRKAL